MELRRKNKLYHLWKQGQILQEDYRVMIRWEKTQKAKAEIESKLADVVPEDKKGFFKYANCK